MNKYLITGAAGFIGFHLTKKLLERGDAVVGIDNINDYYEINLKFRRLAELGVVDDADKWYKIVKSNKYQRFTFIRMNIEDNQQISQLFENEKFDKVCNLAAQAGVRYSLENPNAYIQSNIVGFMNILEACRHNNIKHLVYASSSSVYGNSKNEKLKLSDNVDHPVSLYAATKKSNELMAHSYSYLYNIPTTGLRFFTVYGPWGRPDMALIRFTKAIIEDRPIQVYNKGNIIRDFTYIDDIVEGIIRVIDSPPNIVEESNINRFCDTNAPYRIYNIGNSKSVSILDFITALEKILGKEAKKEYLPMQPGDVIRTEADVTELMQDLGYKPDTPVGKGIERFVEWYKIYSKEQ
jgi:UDP-glucuronate 4-epimerase